MAVQFGKWGEELYHLCRGEDNREVRSHRVRKSLSNENTFFDNLTSLEACEEEIVKLAEDMMDELRAKAGDRKIRNAFVTVKFSDFTRTTRQCVCTEPSAAIYRKLLADAYLRKPLPVRLLGTGVQFAEDVEDEEERQLDLFG
jgi:DNA polymerase-4